MLYSVTFKSDAERRGATMSLVRVSISVFTLALCLIVIAAPAITQDAKPDPRAPYLNPRLPVEQRVDDLVSRMTLDEKVSQMMNAAPAIPRLGIPQYDWWNEALHGVAFSGVATVFPQATSPTRIPAPSGSRHRIGRVNRSPSILAAPST